MALKDALEALRAFAESRQSGERTPFSFANLQKQADVWIASRNIQFKQGDVVTASDVHIPTNFPKPTEVYIILDVLPDSDSLVIDDEEKPYHGLRNDIRILRADRDGDVMPYVTHSGFLRIATIEDIERAESTVTDNICPNCGVDHSLEDDDDNGKDKDRDMHIFEPNQRFKDTPLDELAEEIASVIPDAMRTGDAMHELATFLNKPISAIPTYALGSHPKMVRMFLVKDFDRVYAMLNAESRDTYSDLINEVRDELGVA